MITIFSLPKAWVGPFYDIQHNAITSWTLLDPQCEIILFGDEDGTELAAQRLSVKHVRDVRRTAKGTPLISDLFMKAKQLASYPNICYVNADIILMNDFTAAISVVQRHFKRFLMVGQRRNIQLTQKLTFEGDWQGTIRANAIRSGTFYDGIDYFAYPKFLFGSIPEFAIGRLYWDNWFLHFARHRRAVVVDATPAVLAVHQDHPTDISGSEPVANWNMLGGVENVFMTWEATHQLTHSGIHARCRSCEPICVCDP